MKEAFAADRAAKAYCLRPSTDQAALGQALRLARRAVEVGEDQTQMPFYQLTLGMAEYRNGHFAAADPALLVADQTGGKIATVRGPARLFRAMSLFHQGQHDAARKLFAEAEAQMPPLPANEKQPFKGSFDHDTVIYWLAYKEARGLIAAEPRRP